MSTLSKIKANIDSLNHDFKIDFFYESIFYILNNLSKKNSISIYSLIETLINNLSDENKDIALKNLFKSVSILLNKENTDLFKILEKFFKLLNDDDQVLSLNKMDKILNNINNNITQIVNSNLDIPVPPVSVKIKKDIIQSLKSSIPPPPPKISEFKKITNISNINIPSPKQITRVSETLLEHLKGTNKFLKNKEEQEEIECLYPDEIIKYLIPIISDNGKKALNSFSTPIELYKLLKKIDNIKTLEKLFYELYNDNDFISYIYKISNLSIIKSINLNKNNLFPQEKKIYLKLGEILVFMKIIDKNNLQKLVNLHNISKKNNNFNRKLLDKKLIELRADNNIKTNKDEILFGEFLISSDILKIEKLEEALNFQSKYNEMIKLIQ